MPTLIEISRDLAAKFIEANDKKHAAKHILNEINSLVYPSSKQSIDDGVKSLIVQTIYEIISGKRSFKSKDNEIVFAKPEHISIFLAMSDKLIRKRTENPSLSKRKWGLNLLTTFIPK